jgi:predicted TIM-barrel fold metal-dependent hydrolase
MRSTKAAGLAMSAAALALVMTLVLAFAASGQPGKRRPGFQGPGRPGPALRGGPRNFHQGGPPAGKSANSNVPIYDVHMHIIGGAHNTKFGSAVDAALALMDRYGVRKAVTMSPPRSPQIKQNFDYPDFIQDVRAHPRRLAFMGGGGLLNPLMHGVPDPAMVTEAIRVKFADTARQILQAGARGFGEMSSLHMSLSPTHGYNFVPADHPLLLLLADIAAEHDVPIDLHMDALAKSIPTPQRLAHNQNPPTLPATIPALRRLLEHNPKAKIVWAHGGSDHAGDQTAALVGRMMDRYPNLYVSLRPVPPRAPVMNKLFTAKRIDPAWRKVFTRHADRFVIGNDCFVLPPEVKSGGAPFEFSQSNDRRLRATRIFLGLLPPALARKFAYENAARLYKLGGP